MPIQNTCLPTSIYSISERWLFLGASIQSFDISSGWGQETSQLTVTLVEDPCVNEKKYLDGGLSIQTLNAADPGFLGLSYPIIGCPVVFRCQNFQWEGIIQSWEQINSISGNPTFRVNVVSPIQILEGTKLIIGDYCGSVGAAYNIFNVFGFLEQFGSLPCPQTYLSTLVSGEGPNPTGYLPGDAGVDGSIFGTESGGFGGAYINQNGIQWNRIKTALNILTGAFPSVSNNYSPYGRIIFYGTDGSGYGLCGYDRTEVLGPFSGHSGYYSEYIIDLSELPNPGDYFRLSGNNISILDAINQVCDICSYDYYIELLMVNTITNIAPSGIAKIIKVRAVSRATQPGYGAIQTFINDSGGTVSTSIGKELRAETTTSFLIGGNKQTIYQIEQSDDPEDDGDLDDYPTEADDIILPYFGKDIDEDVIIPRNDNGKWYFYAPLDNINKHLQHIKPLVSPNPDPTKDYDSIKITSTEMLCALEGYDQWISYTMMKQILLVGNQLVAGNYLTELGQAIANTGKFNFDLEGPFGGNNIIKFFDAMLRQGNNGGGARGGVNPRAHNEILQDVFDATNKMRNDDLEAIYNWVYSYANEYYGVRFQVRIPYTCIRQDNTSGAILTSEECSDGGWTDQVSVIKLTNGGANPEDNYIERFKTTDGRLGCFVRYDHNFNIKTRQGLSSLDENDYIIKDNGDNTYSLWLRAEVEKDFVYLEKDTYLSPRAIIRVNTPIREKAIDDNIDKVNFLLILIDNACAAGVPQAQIDIIKAAFQDALNGVGRAWGAVSLLYNYIIPDAAAIPIKSNTNTYGPWVSLGPAGSVRIDQDPGLVPWEYDGMANLNTAANALVANGLSLSQIEEMGEVVIPGYPEVPLGAEIGALAGGFYSGGTNLIENRVIASGNFNENNYLGTPIAFDYVYFDFGAIWLGSYGPHITSINTQVGIEGVQTRYQFRTFTKKFGNMQKLNAERLKEIGKNRLEARRNTIKAVEDKRNRLSWYGRSVGVERVMRDRKGTQLAHKTPHDILVGQIINWHDYDEPGESGNTYRTIIASEDLLDLQSELASNQQNKALMSWDGLIRPISIWGLSGRDGDFPAYPTISAGSSNITQGPGAMPPIISEGGTDEYKPDITYYYLNPFANKTGIAGYLDKLDDRCDIYSGHDIEMLGRGLSGESGNIISPIEESGGDYHPDYRAFALRGPLLINGWGYDTNGFPIPNKADNYEDACDGDYVSTGLQMKFMDNWLKKPKTWVTAPVDLRFDRKRGVWTSPQPYRLIQCEISGDSSAGWDNYPAYTGIFQDYSAGENIWSTTGTELNNAKIAAHDFIDDGTVSPSGSKIIAYYEPNIDKYWILDRRKCYYWGNLADPDNKTGYQDKIYGGSGITLKELNSDEYALQIDTFIGINDTDNCLLTGTSVGTGVTFPRCNSFVLGRGLKAVNFGEDSQGVLNGYVFGLDSSFRIQGISGIGETQYGTSGDANSLTCSFPIVANHSDCGNASISYSGHMDKIVTNNIDCITSLSIDLSGTPCATGCGYSSVTVSVTYGKTRLQFNQWGDFIGTTGLGNTVISDTI